MITPPPPDPIEQFARVEPPPGHVRRVLGRTGPGAPHADMPSRVPPVRWMLPVAATLLVAVGAYVQSARSSRAVPLDVPPPEATWTGKGVDVPVLPPRAYWEMSAFDEFNRLRPERRNARAEGDPLTVAAPHVIRAASVSREMSFSTLGPDLAPPVEAEPIAVEALVVASIDAAPSVALAPISIDSISIRPLAREAP